MSIEKGLGGDRYYVVGAGGRIVSSSTSLSRDQMLQVSQSLALSGTAGFNASDYGLELLHQGSGPVERWGTGYTQDDPDGDFVVVDQMGDTTDGAEQATETTVEVSPDDTMAIFDKTTRTTLGPDGDA